MPPALDTARRGRSCAQPRAASAAVRRSGDTFAEPDPSYSGAPPPFALPDAVPLSGCAQCSWASGAGPSCCGTRATGGGRSGQHGWSRLSAGLRLWPFCLHFALTRAASLAGCAQGSRASCTCPRNCSCLSCPPAGRSISRCRCPRWGRVDRATRISTWASGSLAAGAPPACQSAGLDPGTSSPTSRRRQCPCSRGIDFLAARLATVALTRGAYLPFVRLFHWAHASARVLVASVVRLAG